VNEYKIYEIFFDDVDATRQTHAVCARSVEEAVKCFMANYVGAYSDECTQYQIQNHALICVEAVHDRHYRVEWGIEEHDIRPGMLF